MTRFNPNGSAGDLRVPARRFGEAAAAICDAMFTAGYEIAVVGGPVRDLLAGISPKDVDLTTNARPDDTRRVLSQLGRIYDVGAKYGTIGVAVDGDVYEVTTYRTERYDADSRKPEVVYGDSLEDDLSRRDFTINAMALVADGSGELTLSDPFGGRADLEAGLLRAVGDAVSRFDEDPLRIVRAWRFAVLRNLDIAAATLVAGRRLADRLSIVSRERVSAEMVRVLDEAESVVEAFSVASALGIADVVFGEFASGVAIIDPDSDPGTTETGGTVGRLFVAADLAGLAPDNVSAAVQSLRLPGAVADTAIARSRLVDAVRSASGPDDVELRFRLRRMLRNGDSVDVTAVAESGLLDSVQRQLLVSLLTPSEVSVITADLPISGHDLVSAGLSGPQIGMALFRAEQAALSRPLGHAEALEIALAPWKEAS